MNKEVPTYLINPQEAKGFFFESETDYIFVPLNDVNYMAELKLNGYNLSPFDGICQRVQIYALDGFDDDLNKNNDNDIYYSSWRVEGDKIVFINLN